MYATFILSFHDQFMFSYMEIYQNHSLLNRAHVLVGLIQEGWHEAVKKIKLNWTERTLFFNCATQPIKWNNKLNTHLWFKILHALNNAAKTKKKKTSADKSLRPSDAFTR